MIPKLAQLDDKLVSFNTTSTPSNTTGSPLITAKVQYSQLERVAQDKTLLAMRTIILHTRRIPKVESTTYQLLQDCLVCQMVDQVEGIKIRIFQSHPNNLSSPARKEALDKQKQEKGKCNAFQSRMIRKAKREGQQDLEYYLRPTEATVKELLKLPKEEQLRLWKERDHSQHCVGFHVSGARKWRGLPSWTIMCLVAYSIHHGEYI